MSQGNDTSSFEQSQVMQSLDTLHHPWLHHQQQQQQQQQQQSVSGDQSNLLWDLSSDHSRLYSSPLELFSGSRNGDIFFEGSATAIESVNNADGVQDSTTNQHSTLTARGLNHSGTESGDPLRNEGGRGDSGDEDVSDQGDDDDEQRALGRSGKRHHSKNLIAERNRRKKLNDRLYHLRSLVPKITKMDRASILGDAIEYVLELQKQVKELQDELEEMNLEEDGGRQQNGSNVDTLMNDDGNGGSQRMEQDDSPNSVRMAASNTKIASNLQDISGNDDKGQHQMEPQVEVRQLDGDDFFLRVLCEHKKGGFTKLMEAVSSLGLEVTNANVTTYQSLVLNVFTVKKMDNNNEVVQAEEVRDSLLELTRNPSLGWPDGGQGVVGGGGDYHSQQQLHHQRRHHLSSHHHLNYFQHQI